MRLVDTSNWIYGLDWEWGLFFGIEGGKRLDKVGNGLGLIALLESGKG
jgi:hypothetical protein